MPGSQEHMVNIKIWFGSSIWNNPLDYLYKKTKFQISLNNEDVEEIRKFKFSRFQSELSKIPLYVLKPLVQNVLSQKLQLYLYLPIFALCNLALCSANSESPCT